MRASLILTFFLICGFTSSMAQRTKVISLGMGTTYYYGDLTDQFNNMLLRPAGTIAYTNYFTDHFSFRTAFSFGEIGASDSEALSQARRLRNLHFKSKIYEASGILIYEFRKDKNFGNNYVSEPFITPYVFGGIAFLYFNPQARLNGEWVNLQPLGTEGQFIPGASPGPYSRFQAAAPIGAGLNYRISERMGFSVELGLRVTMTDYLDDVSTFYADPALLLEHSGATAVALSNRAPEGIFEPGDIRGGSSVNDYYFFGMFTLNYYLSRYATSR